MVSHVRLRNGAGAAQKKKRGRRNLLLLFVGILVVGGIWHFHLKQSNLDETIDNLPLAERGVIYDRSGKVLALTLDSFSLYVNARLIDHDTFSERLAPVLGVSKESIEDTLRQGDIQTLLARNIAPDIKDEIDELDLKGVSFHHAKVRYYPQQENAGHLVGYVGSSSIGQGGVEYYYNTLLNGIHRNLQKQDVPVQGVIATAPGKALFLTVDMSIQRILREIVQQLAQEKGGEGSYAAVLMDMDNGAVLGNSQYPFLAPNTYADAVNSARNMQNILGIPIAIPEKIRTILRDAALFQREAEQEQQIVPWCLAPLANPDDFKAGQLGIQYKLWDKLGLNDLRDSDWLRQKELGDSDWSKWINVRGGKNYGSVPVDASSLQIIQALASILMGKGITPHVVDTVVDDQKNAYRILYPGETSLVRSDVSAAVSRLFGAATEKGAYWVRMIDTDSLSYQERRNIRRYSRNRVYCAIIGTRNSKLLLYIIARAPGFEPLVPHAKKSEEIHDVVSAKLVNMILRQEIFPSLVKDLHVQKVKGQKYLKIQVTGSEQSTRNRSRGVILHVMPDLYNDSLRKALRKLNDLNLDIRILGTGKVVEQVPAKNSVVQEGDACKLVLQSD